MFARNRRVLAERRECEGQRTESTSEVIRQYCRHTRQGFRDAPLFTRRGPSSKDKNSNRADGGGYRADNARSLHDDGEDLRQGRALIRLRNPENAPPIGE